MTNTVKENSTEMSMQIRANGTLNQILQKKSAPPPTLTKLYKQSSQYMNYFQKKISTQNYIEVPNLSLVDRPLNTFVPVIERHNI